ncbi:hypothetical protein HPB52_024612 [Rhipicephalus sanguineus]|uniref:Uncharacterized protein n=1 Tax=Rhipicephalus sanguineus TaxID=34632 RepID=A0A9D4PA82_RHISA|nr:hypothetical protein HPB52_024612 [Rhipicephalus sanguineus]
MCGFEVTAAAARCGVTVLATPAMRIWKAGFQQNDSIAEEESSVPDDETSPEDKPSDPSVWPQVMEAFGADSFSDFVTFDNGVIDNEQLSDKKVRATIEGRS